MDSSISCLSCLIDCGGWYCCWCCGGVIGDVGGGLLVMVVVVLFVLWWCCWWWWWVVGQYFFKASLQVSILILVGYLWFRCEAFPTYPRTYDMVHAKGLMLLEARQKRRCTTLDIFTEIDWLLRPEVTNPITAFSLFLQSLCSTTTRQYL